MQAKAKASCSGSSSWCDAQAEAKAKAECEGEWRILGAARPGDALCIQLLNVLDDEGGSSTLPFSPVSHASQSKRCLPPPSGSPFLYDLCRWRRRWWLHGPRLWRARASKRLQSQGKGERTAADYLHPPWPSAMHHRLCTTHRCPCRPAPRPPAPAAPASARPRPRQRPRHSAVSGQAGSCWQACRMLLDPS